MKFIRVHGRVIPIREDNRSRTERAANVAAKAGNLAAMPAITGVAVSSIAHMTGKTAKVKAMGLKGMKVGGGLFAASLVGGAVANIVRTGQLKKRLGVDFKTQGSEHPTMKKARAEVNSYAAGDLGAFAAGYALSAVALNAVKNNSKGIARGIRNFHTKTKIMRAKKVGPDVPKYGKIKRQPMKGKPVIYKLTGK